MRKFRVVEITEDCMGGDSFIALTSATDEAITEAIRLWREEYSQRGFKELSRNYFFKLLLSSDETCHYNEMKSLFDIDKVHLIY